MDVPGDERTRDARCPEGSSGVPVKEVAVEREAVGGAFLRVELGRENIIARQRRGKARAVVGLSSAVVRIGGPHAVAVDEIEPGPIGNAGPEWMPARLG